MADVLITQLPLDGDDPEDRLILTGDPTTGELSYRPLSTVLSAVLEIAPNKSSVSSSIVKRIVIVEADETNALQGSFYFHNGSTLIFSHTLQPQ